MKLYNHNVTSNSLEGKYKLTRYNFFSLGVLAGNMNRLSLRRTCNVFTVYSPFNVKFVNLKKHHNKKAKRKNVVDV